MAVANKLNCPINASMFPYMNYFQNSLAYFAAAPKLCVLNVYKIDQIKLYKL